MSKSKATNRKSGAAVRSSDVVRCVVNQQGAAIINHGWVQSAGNNVVAIGIDMRSKRCIIGATGSNGEVPIIVIDTNSESLHLKRGKEGELTEVSFPDFKGWSVWCADIARYTVAVCLVKREASNDQAHLPAPAGNVERNQKEQ